MRTLWLHGFSGRPREKELQVFLDNGLEPHALDLSYGASSFETLCEYIQKHDIEFLIGYSHGGFFAYWLSEEFGIPSLSISPHFSIRSKSFMSPPITQRISPLSLILLGSDDELVDADRSLLFIEHERIEFPDKNIKTLMLNGVGHGIDPDTLDKYIKWALNEYAMLTA